MSLRIIVLAKQVPDTRNVGKDAMKADGTINRAALPAIFNPEDLNALEQALRLKDAYPGTTVTLLTMGPGRAAEIIREGLYRGADGGFLLPEGRLPSKSGGTPIQSSSSVGLRLKTVIKTSSGGILLNVSSMMICFKVVFSQGFDLAILPGQIYGL